MTNRSLASVGIALVIGAAAGCGSDGDINLPGGAEPGSVPSLLYAMGLDTVRVTLENEIVATVDGPLALTRVGDLLPAPDGSLLVGQPEDRTVMLLSRDGDVVGRVGREGEGPGEFRWISALGWRGDSLWVSDIRGRRITVFNSQLEVVRTEPSPRAGVPIPFVPGKLVLLSDAYSAEVAHPFRWKWPGHSGGSGPPVPGQEARASERSDAGGVATPWRIGVDGCRACCDAWILL